MKWEPTDRNKEFVQSMAATCAEWLSSISSLQMRSSSVQLLLPETTFLLFQHDFSGLVTLVSYKLNGTGRPDTEEFTDYLVVKSHKKILCTAISNSFPTKCIETRCDIFCNNEYNRCGENSQIQQNMCCKTWHFLNWMMKVMSLRQCQLIQLIYIQILPDNVCVDYFRQLFFHGHSVPCPLYMFCPRQ